MLSISISLYSSLVILQAHDEALVLATNCQTHKSLALGWRKLLHRQPTEGRATSTRGSKKHTIDGLAAAVKHTISLLKVSDIETGAPPSPRTNYGKFVKS